MRLVREVHRVTSAEVGLRFQEYALLVFELLPTRAGAKKAIKRGELLIDGVGAETARFMCEGSVVELMEGHVPASKLYRLELPVLYEDDFLAVVNKPAGVPVSGNQFKTVQNALPGVLQRSSQEDALPRFLPVHRLDALTSGLLIVAKTSATRVALGRLFEEKKVSKEYRAIVVGGTPDKGEISFPIGGKESCSSYEKISETKSLKSGALTLLKLTPFTGRTHQLRIHCAKSGFPIAGDTVYGTAGEIVLHKGLFLTATHLSFPHPQSGELLEIEAPLPRKFGRYLSGEARRYEQWGETRP